MKNNEVALKYSNALFELGKENDSLISFQEDLSQVIDLLNTNEDFNKAFFHKRILPGDKKEIVNQIFKGEISQYVLNFINLLIDNRREEHIEAIADNYKDLVNKEETIIDIEVVTAVELSEELENLLLDKLNQILDHKINIHPVVNPDIIGGMVLKFNDFIVDGSIKNNLNKLQRSIKNIPVSMLGV